MTKKNDKRFTLRLVPELNQRLLEASSEQGITKHALIVGILWKHVNLVEKVRKGAGA